MEAGGRTGAGPVGNCSSVVTGPPGRYLPPAPRWQHSARTIRREEAGGDQEGEAGGGRAGLDVPAADEESAVARDRLLGAFACVLHGASQLKELSGAQGSEFWQRVGSIALVALLWLLPACAPRLWARRRTAFLTSIKFIFFTFPLLRRPRGIQRVLDGPATPGLLGVPRDLFRVAWGAWAGGRCRGGGPHCCLCVLSCCCCVCPAPWASSGLPPAVCAAGAAGGGAAHASAGLNACPWLLSLLLPGTSLFPHPCRLPPGGCAAGGALCHTRAGASPVCPSLGDGLLPQQRQPLRHPGAGEGPAPGAGLPNRTAAPTGCGAPLPIPRPKP